MQDACVGDLAEQLGVTQSAVHSSSANPGKACHLNGYVAFGCISTGEFHFPNDKAAEIAVETVKAFLEKHGDCLERVIFNVFKDNDRNIYEKILG